MFPYALPEKYMNQILLDIVKHLNHQFQIIPILYASYAVEKVLGSSVGANDIDLLIPSHDFYNRKTLISYLETQGFIHFDDEVIAFQKDGVRIELADDEVWLHVCDIDQASLHTIKHDESEYLLMGASNLIKLYKFLSSLQTRSEIKRTKDLHKINLLRQSILGGTCLYQ
jgi:hypothetical protein